MLSVSDLSLGSQLCDSDISVMRVTAVLHAYFLSAPNINIRTDYPSGPDEQSVRMTVRHGRPLGPTRAVSRAEWQPGSRLPPWARAASCWQLAALAGWECSPRCQCGSWGSTPSDCKTTGWVMAIGVPRRNFTLGLLKLSLASPMLIECCGN